MCPNDIVYNSEFNSKEGFGGSCDSVITSRTGGCCPGRLMSDVSCDGGSASLVEYE